MIAVDENALICDFAETYNIYDYRSLPVKLAATYSAGLRENSRSKMKLRGDTLGDSDRSLMAMIYDALAMLGWIGDGEPPSMLKAMYGELPEAPTATNEIKSFDTPEDYERARKEMIERRK